MLTITRQEGTSVIFSCGTFGMYSGVEERYLGRLIGNCDLSQ